MKHRQDHFDTLKVARNAPPEVVRAAYKALSQRYHPDRNADSEAAAIMCSLNLAYSVLSDPGKRLEYEDELTELAPSIDSVSADADLHRKHLSGTDYRPRGSRRARRRQKAVTRFSLLVFLVFAGAVAAFIVQSEHAYAVSMSAHEQSGGADAARTEKADSKLSESMRVFR